MNAIFKLGLNCMLAAVFSMAIDSGNQARAQHWEGRSALGGTTSFTRNADGTWTERNSAVYRFEQVEATPEYILLHDASRDVRVALYSDKVLLRNNLNGEWIDLYRGSWTNVSTTPGQPGSSPNPSNPNPSNQTSDPPTAPPTVSRPTDLVTTETPSLPRTNNPSPTAPQSTDNYHYVWYVRFTKLVVRDDKEIGSGDWRITARIKPNPEITIVNKIEGGTGQALALSGNDINFEYGESFRLLVSVHERDGGDWEYVGQKEIRVTRDGTHKLDFNNSEGRVEVHFETREIGFYPDGSRR